METVHSAINRVWTVEQEARYFDSLSPREAFHLAVDVAQGIVGFQSLDLWSPLLTSTAHVGQVGTFLLPEWRTGLDPEYLTIRYSGAAACFR